MSIWGRLFGGEKRAAKVASGHPRDPILASWLGGSDDIVTPDSALRVTAVYACVSLISEMIGLLPLHVYRRDGESSAKAKDHPLYEILRGTPTPGLTSFEWRETMTTHRLLRGDAYARIVTRGDGRIVSLPLIMPWHIRPERSSNGGVRYVWYEEGRGPARILMDDEVLRLPHKMLDGINSLSPVALHRKTIGNAMASTRFMDSFLRNNASPKGGIKVPNTLSTEAVQALRKSWEDRHMGAENAGRLAIFDGGMEWMEMGMSMQDAQYIETQQFAIADIARIYLVPPHKVGDLSRATFSNIEHQAIQFVTDCLMSQCRRIESRMNQYLLSEADRKAGYYIEFDLKGLLAGDSQARSAFYRALFSIGAMTQNEIRAAENYSPITGGDRAYVQGAYVPIDKIDEFILKGGKQSPPDQQQDGTNDQAQQQ